MLTDAILQAVFLRNFQGWNMDVEHRSGCPINLALEVLGDKWSLLIIRDMIFGERRHFRELLTQSEEGIASNILSDRLKRLLDEGIVTKAEDPTHKQRALYSLTEKGIELLPVLAQMSMWGLKYQPVSEELAIRAELLKEGGPRLWHAFMDELRQEHLAPAARTKRRARSIRDKMQEAYEAVVAKRASRDARSPRR
jgi:DNA-binding HxlR family transcriptional regulator